jgi:hypothetical protein
MIDGEGGVFTIIITLALLGLPGAALRWYSA